MKSIIDLENERMEWSFRTFPEATYYSSLNKLEEEIREVRAELEKRSMHNERYEELSEEYADCLMCLFDSAGRAGIHPNQIVEAFEKKLAKNKAREWKKNPDNTYSHVKASDVAGFDTSVPLDPDTRYLIKHKKTGETIPSYAKSEGEMLDTIMQLGDGDIGNYEFFERII